MMIVVVSSHRIAMHIQGVQKIEIIFIIAILTSFTLFEDTLYLRQ